jgi:acylpyruvate hydrolase
MRLLTYKINNQYRPGYLIGKHVVDIQAALEFFNSDQGVTKDGIINIPPSLKSFLALSESTKAKIEQALQFFNERFLSTDGSVARSVAIHALEEISFAPPIPDPGKIICVAMNFPSSGQKHKSEYPIIFIKPISTISSTHCPIKIAKANQSVAYEAELAIIIGKQCHNVSLPDAFSCVFGYTIANDVGDSTLEKRTSQWVSGKMFDTFTPMGPYLITTDEINKPGNLSIRTILNGEIVQEGNTADMFYSIPEIITYLSTLTTLNPGDIILSGSPKLMNNKPIPRNYLISGDQVDITIDNLGMLSNKVIKGD